MLTGRKIDRKYSELCAAQYAEHAPIVEAAAVLVVAQSGVTVDLDTVSKLADRLGSFADKYGLMPEEVQIALLTSEPNLGHDIGTLDF